MAASQLRVVLRHIEKLSAVRVEERTDRQLLDDFASHRDEAAFTRLVDRHGPMVFRVCRRVLHQQQDAEDAYQATFLILARCHRSIRKREAVADWLHGVAYRTALKARRGAARRRNHEARSGKRTPASTGPSWDDVQAVLDEEIQRLPEAFRSAFVLCVLEGKTVAAVAAELGCKEGTVSSRLTRARQRLQGQLARRGIKLGVLLAALSLVEGDCNAAVAGVLMQATVKSGLLVASGWPVVGVVPSRIALLATGVARAMMLNKASIVMAVVLAMSVLAGACALTCRAIAAKDAGRPSLPATAQKTESSTARPNAKKQEADDKESIGYGGRVLGWDGRPVVGAKLYVTSAVVHENRQSPTIKDAITGRDGRFAFTVPKEKLDERFTIVAVTAPGQGTVWTELSPNDRRDDLTIRLVKDDVPITGQIVDLEGKPVAGATLTVLLVGAAIGEDLDSWLEAARTRKLQKDQSLRAYKMPQSPEAKTDAEGRFRLGGIGLGRNRFIRVRLDGPTIASQYLTILTRPGKPIEVKEYRGQPGTTICYGADFRHAAAPTKPVVGVVRDKETNKPLAGVTIESNKLANSNIPGRNIVQTATDDRGHYRLIGLPKGEGNKIRLVPRNDQPYVSVHAVVPDTPGLEPATVDFALKRGLWIEGKLTDKGTGKPVQGHVQYFALNDNPHLRDYPGFAGTTPPLWGIKTKEDGSYRLVGLPGPGLVVVCQTGRHLTALERDDEFGMKEEPSTSPYQLAPLVNYMAVARIDPARGTEVLKRDLTLDAGWTFTGKLLDPDGNPLAGALGFGVNDRFPPWNSEGIKSAEFIVRTFSPRAPRDVLFMHPQKGLIGVAQPPKENGKSVIVRMEPGAAVTGRLVDGDGKPRAGVELEVTFHTKGKWGGWPPMWRDYFPAHVKTDGEGRFRLEPLLPDFRFRLSDGKGELTFDGLRSGRTKDLGDVQTKPEEE
jgi:RNA polymerase sigma factor (sigma-70 family)